MSKCMDFVSAVREAMALSIPSSLRPTAEISCKKRSIVASCAVFVMIPGGADACSSEVGDDALGFCRASEKSNFRDGLPDYLPDVLPPGNADSQSRVWSGRLRKRREIPVEERWAKRLLDVGKQMTW
ncbi:hypothetical protein NDU88_001491 [Pleurodeles waltl]|uniref:Uncharacterized protein n=1 Tax=Pleurodeles waltl TaxID=8319 RepID=A0AAV7MJW8_PLEWA|nr:hypothetical protein NDU88_001491 [Pleurodeles waltl]